MSTTIRITDEDKERLHRVQRRLTDLTGKKFTLQRILGLMAQHAEQEPAHIIGHGWKPFTPGEIRAIEARVKALGGWTGGHEDIDAIVYDEP